MNTDLPSNGNNNPFEIFNYKNLGSVRTTKDENGNPLFCLNDVCSILGLNNNDINKVASRIDEPYQNYILVGVQTGVKNDGTPAIQNVKMIFVNEPGLYQAIGRSRKPEARNFMDWVFREVLPSIREKGYYSMNNSNVSQIDILKGMINVFEENQKKFKEIDERLSSHARVINRNSKDIKVVSKEGYFTIATVAKLKGISLSLESAQELGKRASKICEDHSLIVGTVPHPEFGRVHTYPYKVISDLLDDYFVK